MKLPTYQFVAQMGAAFAVVASLALVAYELKLNRDMAMADVYQQATAMAVEYQASMLSNERLQDALETNREDPSQLSKRELLLVLGYLDGWVWQKEADYYQYTIGMIDDTEWATHQKIIKGLGGSPCYRYAWNNKGRAQGLRADFAAEVNRIWADIPNEECQYGDWK
jgi:hypothetical protein